MIEWPEQWDEGWGSYDGRPLTIEYRTWAHLGDILSTEYRMTRTQRIEHLGGPPGRMRGRTLEQAKDEIKEHFKKNGKRPTVTTSSAWTNKNAWLGRQGSSLRQICDEMKLPVSREFTRSLPEAKKAIKAYYEKHGVRPAERVSKEWMNWQAWLRRRGSSIAQICNEAGLPETARRLTKKEVGTRIRLIKKEARAYKKAHGRRPTQRDVGWNRHECWLRYNLGMGLPTYLDQEGIR